MVYHRGRTIKVPAACLVIDIVKVLAVTGVKTSKGFTSNSAAVYPLLPGGVTFDKVIRYPAIRPCEVLLTVIV